MKDKALTAHYSTTAKALLHRACAHFAIPLDQLSNDDEAQAVVLLYLDDRLGHLEAHA